MTIGPVGSEWLKQHLKPFVYEVIVALILHITRALQSISVITIEHGTIEHGRPGCKQRRFPRVFKPVVISI